jgi:hypothetical protein
MALFLAQAKEVDIIITTALIRTFSHIGRMLIRSWKTGAPFDLERTCRSYET